MNSAVSLDDFKKQLQQVKRLGPMRKVMGMIPGMGQMMEGLDDVDPEQDMKRLFGMIDSMTPDEKRDPKLIDQSRRRRIAAGSGVEPHQVNELVKMFEPMARMMERNDNTNDGSLRYGVWNSLESDYRRWWY